MNRFFANFYNSPLKVYAVLILVPLLLFSKSLYYGFSPMDETWLITGNTAFLEDSSNPLKIFKNEIQGVYYRPLLVLTFLVDYTLGGLNPFVYHLSNIMFHIFAVILLYKFLRHLKIEQKVAFVLSLLFAVHPMVIHAVTWVPGRNDALLCIFFLLSAIYLLKYLDDGKYIQIFLHFLFFLMAMLTKESAVALPLVFLSLYLLGSGKKTGLLMFLGSWILAFFTWFYLRQQILLGFSIQSGDFFSTAFNFTISLIAFSGKSLIPVSQSVTPVIDNSLIWLNAILTLAFAILCYFTGLKNKKLALFGLFTFYAILFLPVWFGAQTTLGEQYEHRAYTALIGLIVFLSQINFRYESPIFKTALALIFMFFTLKTIYRQNIYKTEISYLDEGMRDCPRNYFFYSQKGILLYFEKRFSEALPYMNKAIEIYPGQVKLHSNRGNVHFALAHKKEAIDDFTKALKLSNYKSSIYLSRCVAYKNFGEIEKAKEDMDAIKSRYPEILPKTLEKEINTLWLENKAKTLGDKILKDPGNAKLYVERAQVFFYLRKGPQALADLKKATELEPGNKEYRAYYQKLNSTYPNKQGS